MKIKKIEESHSHTWDIEVPEVHEYILGNGCISHNTSGKGINAIESIEPIQNFFYKEEGTINIPAIVPNFKLNNQHYVKAFDCDQFMLVRNAAIRQKWVDQSQSVNVYIKRPDSLKYLASLHNYGFYLGMKTFYYVKSQKGDDEEICESCS